MTILDATCSVGRKWPKYADIRIDIDIAAKPDVVMDCRHTTFPNDSFSEIYCDPPHLVRRNPQLIHRQGDALGKRYSRFSAWKDRNEWYGFLDGINVEFARILVPGGLLQFKVPEGGKNSSLVSFRDLNRLTNFEIIADDRRESHGFFANWHRSLGHAISYIHFITLRLRTEDGEDSV